MTTPRKIVIWADLEQQPLIAEVIKRIDGEVIAAGSPDASNAAALGHALDVERLVDLRQAILTDDADLILLAARGEMTVETRRLLRETGRPAVSLEPHPSSLTDVVNDTAESQTARVIPLMRRSIGLRTALERIDDFGIRRCVNVFFRCRIGEGSLRTRLFDAMDVVDTLCGSPELLDAALASPINQSPETLAEMTGHLTLNMRFADNRCACVAVSDRGGRWFRGVTVLGEGGCLRITDHGYEWIAPDGTVLDEHEESSKPATSVDAIADDIQRLLDGLDQGDAPVNTPRLLALCETTRVSCRTAQSEAPRKMLEIVRRP